MAVFLVNICKFQDCSQKFSTLRDLIHHIEEIHIATDPRILEKQELQQPSSLPLSYVLRLCERENSVRIKARQRTSSVSPVPSLSSHRSSTPTGSEFDDEERQSEADNSDDSWTNQDTFTSDIILSMMGSHKDSDSDKPFVCPVPGCKKRYKNVNGIKYHAKHGHKKDLRVKKPFRCKCGKSYRSASGLRHHTLVTHPLATSLPLVTDTSLPLVTNNSLPLATNSISTTSTIVNINPQTSRPNSIHKQTTLVATTTNCATIPMAALNPRATINHASINHTSISSLLPTQKACAALPPGTLTFAMPSGGLQVAVPVSQVISIPPPQTHIVEHDPGANLMDCGMDVLEPLGALETVETFNGLETSIDDTKAD